VGNLSEAPPAPPHPLRLLHVLEAFLGGTRRFLLDVCEGLPREDFLQHALVSPLRAEDFGDMERLRASGVEVSLLPMTRAVSPISDLRCYLALRRILFAWRPHVLHAHSSKAGFLARAAAESLPIEQRPTVIYSPHCFAFQARTGALHHLLYRTLERAAAAWTDAYVFVGQGEVLAALDAGLHPRREAHLLPLPVDATRFTATPTRSRADLGLPDGRLLAMIGGLRPQKAPDLALHAFAEAAPDVPDAHLVFVGEGPLRAQLDALTARLGLTSRVTFLGSRDDLPDLLPYFEAVLLASLWEAMPYSILEAMAASRPIVLADLPGPADEVAEARAGLTFHPHRRHSLAAAIRGIMMIPPAQRASFGASGAAFVRTRHNPTESLAALGSIYQALAPNI
jgi:glycosyltransferase involved in cell wall biosynthesis